MTDTGMDTGTGTVTVTGTGMGTGTGSGTWIDEFLMNSSINENLINDYGCGCGYYTQCPYGTGEKEQICTPQEINS